MNSSKGESHLVSHVSELCSFGEPSLDRAWGRWYSLDHEEDDIPFKMVHRTCQLLGPSASIPPALEAIALAPTGLAGLASTMTREDILHLRGKYGVPNQIRISTLNPNDRVTLDPEGVIALYEGFFHACLCLPFYPLFVAFWTTIDSFRPNLLQSSLGLSTLS